jgi:glycine/D-amino acid oxidase-like deaminating enzyme
MPRLRLGTPLWLARRRRSAIHFPTLRRPIHPTSPSVGGGITGATIAWRFAEAGLRVALLEARRVGRGSTAASTALLMQEPDFVVKTVLSVYSVRSTRFGPDLNDIGPLSLRHADPPPTLGFGVFVSAFVDCDPRRSRSFSFQRRSRIRSIIVDAEAASVERVSQRPRHR